jgi:hypothetical protein
MPYFWPERVEAFEPQYREIAANLVQSLRERDELEIISTFAQWFAVRSQCAFLGWPPEMCEPLRLWTQRNHQANFAEDRVAMTLKQRLRTLAPGLTPRAVLEKFAGIQMVDVHLPTTDGRHLVLSRHTEPDADQTLLLQRLKMVLPQQPPPRIAATATTRAVVPTF